MFGRHFLTLADYNQEDLLRIIATARQLKALQKAGIEHRLLKGKTLAMVFQKPSNRTRVSFEVGMYQLGGMPINIRHDEIQIGKRESVPDVSRVLSRYVDAVMMRVLRHTDIVSFAEASTIPVINGLSDMFHPCQAIADLLTISEHKEKLKGFKLCYIGDGNNVCNSLILMCNLVGIEMVVCCPEGYEPSIPPEKWKYTVERKPETAIAGADIAYSDVWTSMGQEEESLNRLRAFEGYCVTSSLLAHGAKDLIFMHCLPAHRGEEVDDLVVDSNHSVVFDQAENRLHAQKALLLLLMSKNPEQLNELSE